MKTVKLSEFAKLKNISYITAYRWFKNNEMPCPAHQTPSGTILVDITEANSDYLNLDNASSDSVSLKEAQNLMSLIVELGYFPNNPGQIDNKAQEICLWSRSLFSLIYNVISNQGYNE